MSLDNALIKKYQREEQTSICYFMLLGSSLVLEGRIPESYVRFC